MNRLYILLAFTSIALWSFLAFLGARLNTFPPLFIAGIALTLSGLLSLFNVKKWKIPLKTFLVGVGGIFGYHAFYFAALSHAPAVEANLINYLWPLLIVLGTPAFFRGRKLYPHHLAGALMGFAGAALVITQGHFSLSMSHWTGYLFALLAAIVWASYSLMTKRLPPFPSAAVGAFCLTSGILALILIILQGKLLPTLGQLHASDWKNLVYLGLGPLGLAFFSWDAALKRGDPRVIGALTYLTPLFSTLILVKVGGFHLSQASAAGMAAIVLGALIGSFDFLKRTQSTL